MIRKSIVIITIAVSIILLSSSALAAATPTPTGATYQHVLKVLNNVVSFVLEMAGFAAVATVIYFGVRMLTAGGNEEVYAAARKGLNWALIGSLVIFGVYTIIATVYGAVGSLSR